MLTVSTSFLLDFLHVKLFWRVNKIIEVPNQGQDVSK